jgi:hypothetical protein
MTAGVPFRRISSAANVRPSIGVTPNTRKKPSVTGAMDAKTGSEPPRTVSGKLWKAAIVSKLRLRSRQSTKLGFDTATRVPFSVCSHSRTMRSGDGYGSGLSSTPWTTVNMAVFAPMPSASVRIASAAKPGRLMSIRSAWRRSCVMAVVS